MVQMCSTDQVLPSDLFEGVFKRPVQGLSDLCLGDPKVTWKKLGKGVCKKTYDEEQRQVQHLPINEWLMLIGYSCNWVYKIVPWI